MEEYSFYTYDKENDKIIICCEDVHTFFENYDIKIDSIDFDENSDVALFMSQLPNIDKSELEKEILEKIENLNDIQIGNMKIILIFNSREIELA